jgi:TM2 domain-containing membrane protein YozV
MISVNKIFFILIFILCGSITTFAQDSFQQQFDLAKKLYDEEKYFDAVTEFKRLLFFNETGKYLYEANKLIGLSYKEGAKFSDAIHFLTLAEMNASTTEQIYGSKIEIIKINILRRTTSRALSLLDDLRNDERFNDRSDEINYWTGWTYIFANEWVKASAEFALIDSTHFLKAFCDSVKSDFYNITLAKTLSIIPGAGQFYTGEYISGLISIGWNVLWGYLTINAFNEDRIFDGVMIGTLLWWRFYSGNLQNAEKFATEKNLKKTNAALRYLQNNYIGKKP